MTAPQLDPLGDQALLARFTDFPAAIAWYRSLVALAPEWLIEVVPAYANVAVFFDEAQISRDTAADVLATITPTSQHGGEPGQLWSIPVCYERGLDLDSVAGELGQNSEQVVARHLDRDYLVFAIGFVPGFGYLGPLADGIAGIPRRQTPRVRVEAGSVGITGRQTGVYPLDRPGGWALIGQTPRVLVDVADDYFPIRVGDTVRFTRIDEAEFTRQRGLRLT